MDNVFSKHSDTELAVVETKPAEVLPPRIYNIVFLKQQLEAITRRRDLDNELRAAEIAEVEALLSQAAKLGVAEKASTEIVEEAVITP